jgi:arylsulfatase A-like enzyme
VQLSSLIPSPRGGDIVLSAAEGWDLRSRFEPTPHVSTHGALLRDQMTVPLILDAPPLREPQRTTDVVPSALDILGITGHGQDFDGRSFY